MARKKATKTSIKNAKPLSDMAEGFLSQVKWGESYTSLFLGAVVVVVALFLVFSLLKSKNVSKQTGSSSTTVNEQTATKSSLPKTYTVKEGDDLWTIAQNIYGSGYNWVDLANANKLENPGLLYAGAKLTVPDVKPRVLTLQNTQVQKPVSNPISGSTYTVEKGDYLWEIAIRAYGDGYKWVEIAKANNLTNPDLIFSGNVLKLPR